MNLTNHTTKSKKNKYLTEIDRYKIEVLKKQGISNVEIAKEIEKSDRTIRRKIKRGTIKILNSDLSERTEYCADVDQMKYRENAVNKGPGLKIGADHKLADYIEDRIINEEYSPDAVSVKLKKKVLSLKRQSVRKLCITILTKKYF